jgi:hypothetical protein
VCVCVCVLGGGCCPPQSPLHLQGLFIDTRALGTHVLALQEDSRQAIEGLPAVSKHPCIPSLFPGVHPQQPGPFPADLRP